MGGKGVVVGRGRGEQGESGGGGGGGGLSHIKAFPRDQSEEKEEEGKQRDDYFLCLSGDIWRATTVVLHCRYTVLLARKKVVESLLYVYFLIGARPQLNMFLQSFAIVKAKTMAPRYGHGFINLRKNA